jgi:hypothetical protein
MIIAIRIYLGLACAFLFTQAYGQADSKVYKTVKTKIAGQYYTAIVDTTFSLTIKNGKNRTTQHIKNTALEGEGVHDIRFIDVNGDGYKDLVVEYNSNVPDRRDLLLFDKTNGRFRLIKDYPDFPAAIRIPRTYLYYSYHRSGCADLDWDSDLFEIVNFKIVRMGNISGQACDDDESHGIFIYKTVNGSAKLVKKLPMSNVGDYANGKWGFIADYWMHNYKEFVSEFNRLPASRAFAGSDN